MKELHGEATRVVPASREECLALVEAVDGYPSWYPEVVREVEVLQRHPAGQPSQVRTRLHLAWGALVQDFDLVMAVVVEPPSTVKLSRVGDAGSDQRFDVIWQLTEADGTRIALSLAAALRVSRFVPLGGIGNGVADGFVSAAARALAS